MKRLLCGSGAPQKPIARSTVPTMRRLDNMPVVTTRINRCHEERAGSIMAGPTRKYLTTGLPARQSE